MIAFFVKLAETGWSLVQYKVWLWRLHWFTDQTIRWVLVSFVGMLITIWGFSAVGILWRIICQSPPDRIFFPHSCVKYVINKVCKVFFQDRTKYVIYKVCKARFRLVEKQSATVRTHTCALSWTSPFNNTLISLAAGQLLLYVDPIGRSIYATRSRIYTWSAGVLNSALWSDLQEKFHKMRAQDFDHTLLGHLFALQAITG